MSNTYSSNQKPKLPSWMQWEGTGIGWLDTILVLVGIPLSFLLLGLGLFGTVWAAGLFIGTCSAFTNSLADGFTAEVLQNIFFSAIAGFFAGLALIIFRHWRVRPSQIESSMLAAIFTKGMETIPYAAVFYGRVLVGGIIGAVVGAAAAPGKNGVRS